MASAVEKRARAAPRIQNVLYTTDFSACSQAAAPYVAAIARRFGATVHLVHVLPPKLVAIGEYGLCIPEFEANRKPAVRKKLHDVCRSGLFDGILSSRTLEIADLGEIRRVVAELVTMMNIDLIVLGTHGFRGIKHFVIGSVAEQLVRGVTCPVLTIRPALKQTALANGRVDRIVYATDFSPASLDALRHAVFFTEAFDAHIRLLHAVHQGDAVSEAGLIARAKEKLHEFVASERHIRYPVAAQAATPAYLILRLSKAWKADLIIMGSHRASAIAAHSPFAVAHEVICKAPCPVLMAHAAVALSKERSLAEVRQEGRVLCS